MWRCENVSQAPTISQSPTIRRTLRSHVFGKRSPWPSFGPPLETQETIWPDPALTSTSEEGDTPVASTVASAAASAALARLAWHGRRHRCKKQCWMKTLFICAGSQMLQTWSKHALQGWILPRYNNLDFGEVLFGLEQPFFHDTLVHHANAKTGFRPSQEVASESFERSTTPSLKDHILRQSEAFMQCGFGTCALQFWSVRITSRSHHRVHLKGRQLSSLQRNDAKSIAMNEHSTMKNLDCSLRILEMCRKTCPKNQYIRHKFDAWGWKGQLLVVRVMGRKTRHRNGTKMHTVMFETLTRKWRESLVFFPQFLTFNWLSFDGTFLSLGGNRLARRMQIRVSHWVIPAANIGFWHRHI